MEIVVVSDTVRQRRSRTPISPSSFEGLANGDMNGPSVMPDLLPKVQSDNRVSDESRKKIQSRDENENIKLSQENVTDTIDVYESVKRFAPEQVETVHIVDVSSDSDASTPNFSRKLVKSLGSIDELKSELEQELDSVFDFDTPTTNQQNSLIVKKQKISFTPHETLQDDDRDLLAEKVSSVKNLKIRRTLKEIWMEERVNSFYSPENDNDEPVVFSEDEEIPRYSVEMDSDSDDVVA